MWQIANVLNEILLINDMFITKNENQDAKSA